MRCRCEFRVCVCVYVAPSLLNLIQLSNLHDCASWRTLEARKPKKPEPLEHCCQLAIGGPLVCVQVAAACAL